MTKRDKYLQKKYGITEADFNKVLADQGGCCGVCRRDASIFGRKLCVDHDHKTGQIRGLLCIHCNRYVIGRHTDPELLLRASRYLRSGTGRFVPVRVKKRKRRKRNVRAKKD